MHAYAAACNLTTVCSRHGITGLNRKCTQLFKVSCTMQGRIPHDSTVLTQHVQRMNALRRLPMVMLCELL
jgi:hypothetical protein